MSDLPLTLAISDYDHVRDLTTGRVRVEGVELTCLSLSVEEIFFRFMAFREWDVSEMSMAKYVSVLSSGDSGLTAIPVFPSRVFRHSAFYVAAGSRVRQPADLRNGRVGVPEWAQTATVYARALLAHEHGLPLDAVEWFQAGVSQPGRREQASLSLPTGIRCTPVPDRSLNDMLLAGDLDAIISAHAPPAFEDGTGRITRLFPDHEALDAEYYRRTRVFPIMHIIAMRREVFESHPWVAMNLLKAFEAAKQRSLGRLRDATASRLPIPWAAERLADAAQLLGQEPWAYGLEANRTTLEAFLLFCHEQGITDRRLGPEELVPDEVKVAFRV